ncbi:MAG: peptidylprolyl isomerase [Ahrensia sp.]|mgnify:FL=1|nr:peptidylprolyl isomerase [Ahrensia sp.]
MLDGLRKSSKSWVAKALLLLLLASFAVWGVSGSMLSGGASNAVLTAGETKVSAVDYRLAYDRQMVILSRQLGERLTRDQARQFGIEQAVLGQMVAGAVLDEQSRVMNLGLSKDRLATLVADDPTFQGVNGQFSRDTFRQVLRTIGMSEDDYIRNRQDVAIRQQIVEAVSDGIEVPQVMLEAFAKHTGEKRDVEYFFVGESAIEPVSAPSDDVLQAYFEANKAAYRAPEYRKINFVRLTPDAIVDEASVPEADVRADYEARRDRYSTPETRAVEQLVFSDQTAADAAYERILAGQSFEDAVADAGKTMSDVQIGTMSKSDLPDQAIADAAFSLSKPGDVSGVIDGTFGPVIVRVTEINPESVKPIEEVSADIRRELAMVTANDTLLDIHDAYEDARAAGETMQEAAADQKLKMQTIDVDTDGNAPSGEPVASIPEQRDLIAAAFEAEEGAENSPLNAADSGFLWYEVAGITPARDRTFDEIRERVTADWIADETDKRISEQAKALADRMDNGETLTQVAEAEGFTVETKYGLQRGGNDGDFGAGGITEIFNGGPEHKGTVASPSGNGYIVYAVSAVTQPVGGIETLGANVRDTIKQSISDDLLDQLVAKLQTIYPVRVNQSALERALGTQ